MQTLCCLGLGLGLGLGLVLGLVSVRRESELSYVNWPSAWLMVSSAWNHPVPDTRLLSDTMGSDQHARRSNAFA